MQRNRDLGRGSQVGDSASRLRLALVCKIAGGQGVAGIWAVEASSSEVQTAAFRAGGSSPGETAAHAADAVGPRQAQGLPLTNWAAPTVQKPFCKGLTSSQCAPQASRLPQAPTLSLSLGHSQTCLGLLTTGEDALTTATLGPAFPRHVLQAAYGQQPLGTNVSVGKKHGERPRAFRVPWDWARHLQSVRSGCVCRVRVGGSSRMPLPQSSTWASPLKSEPQGPSSRGSPAPSLGKLGARGILRAPHGAQASYSSGHHGPPAQR